MRLPPNPYYQNVGKDSSLKSLNSPEDKYNYCKKIEACFRNFPRFDPIKVTGSISFLLGCATISGGLFLENEQNKELMVVVGSLLFAAGPIICSNCTRRCC